MVGPVMLSISVTFLSSETIDSGRERRVAQVNAATGAWLTSGGGYGELEASSFFTVSDVDGLGRTFAPVASSESCTAGRDQESGAGLNSNPKPLRYSFASSASQVLLLDQPFLIGHRSRIAVAATWGSGAGATDSTFTVAFPTFTENGESMSSAACSNAHGVWLSGNGNAEHLRNGLCSVRRAATSVCVAIALNSSGAWCLAPEPTSCGIVYAPISQTLDHHFSSLQVTLRHNVDPDLLSDRLTGRSCDFGPASTVHSSEDTILALLVMVLGIALSSLVCLLLLKLVRQVRRRRQNPDTLMARRRLRRPNKHVAREIGQKADLSVGSEPQRQRRVRGIARLRSGHGGVMAVPVSELSSADSPGHQHCARQARAGDSAAVLSDEDGPVVLKATISDSSDDETVHIVEALLRQPTEIEVAQFAMDALNLDPITDAELLWIAREALVAPLPVGWVALREGGSEGAFYFHHAASLQVSDEHPADARYRRLAKTELTRKKRECAGAGTASHQEAAREWRALDAVRIEHLVSARSSSSSNSSDSDEERSTVPHRSMAPLGGFKPKPPPRRPRLLVFAGGGTEVPVLPARRMLFGLPPSTAAGGVTPGDQMPKGAARPPIPNRDVGDVKHCG